MVEINQPLQFTPPNHGAETATGRTQSKEREALQEFESLFLAKFVDEMLKTVKFSETEGQFGGEMWRSFMSEAIAENLIKRGGLGITDNIGRMTSAYKQSAD